MAPSSLDRQLLCSPARRPPRALVGAEADCERNGSEARNAPPLSRLAPRPRDPAPAEARSGPSRILITAPRGVERRTHCVSTTGRRDRARRRTRWHALPLLNSGAMPKKERAAKAAALAIAKELDSEMTEEEKLRIQNAGMGTGGGLNKGEEKLFDKKLTKEEKKAQAEAKKAEREAKKAAKKAAEGVGDDCDDDTVDITDNGENDEASTEAKKSTSKSAGSKKGAKGSAAAAAGNDGEILKIDEGTLKFAVCTGNLASRKDSKDVKIQAFSISLFGKVRQTPSLAAQPPCLNRSY